MNILFLTVTRVSDINERGIYTDLMREFRDHGHKIFIVAPTERRYKEETSLKVQDNITILNVKSFNIQKTNVVEKGIGTLLLEYQFAKAIDKYYSQIVFDLIIYSTPPITLSKVIKKLKLRDRALCYLLLKDIFPQNAVDLGMIKERSLIHRFFNMKERELYEISDYIGCMSPANVQYIKDNHPQVDPHKLEVNPNSIQPVEANNSVNLRKTLRTKYSIPLDSIVFVYGGNLGKPQGLDFLLEVLESNMSNDKVFFLIIGTGTEYGRLKSWFAKFNPSNALLISTLPKVEYDNLLETCDVGLIFLDSRFTIPNFPSRMLSYMEFRMPIVAATDLHTDIGKIIEINNFGYWCKNGDLDQFNAAIEKFLQNDSQIRNMGELGYNYLTNNYLSCHSYNIIMKQAIIFHSRPR
ncbi:MAG: glycosyltransferase WbuB [Flavobacterium sp.]|nr:MAG: glycosyltransferase WbuB [Flavobacterium sp.]